MLNMSCVRLQSHSNGTASLSLPFSFPFHHDQIPPFLFSPLFPQSPSFIFFSPKPRISFPFKDSLLFLITYPFPMMPFFLSPFHYITILFLSHNLFPCLLQMSISFLSLAYMVMFQKFQDLIFFAV